MSLKCNMLNFLCTDLWACIKGRYEVGLKFKDLLFSIFSRLNPILEGGGANFPQAVFFNIAQKPLGLGS